jgi:hypothetical protein
VHGTVATDDTENMLALDVGKMLAACTKFVLTSDLFEGVPSAAELFRCCFCDELQT